MLNNIEGLDNMNVQEAKDAKKDQIKQTAQQLQDNEDTRSIPEDVDISKAKKTIAVAHAIKQNGGSKLDDSVVSGSTEASTTEDSTTTTTTTTSETFRPSMGNENKKMKGSRIDYGTTIENAYDDLNKILGSDGINKLTTDTQKLMEQQMKLAEAMNNMGPIIQNAKDMLKTMDIKSLGDIGSMLKGIQ